MFDMKACGARIKELRKKNNETQETAAYNLYISQDHLRKIESGKSGASIDLLIDIAEYSDTPLDYLVLGRTGHVSLFIRTSDDDNGEIVEIQLR